MIHTGLPIVEIRDMLRAIALEEAINSKTPRKTPCRPLLY